jgi:hypothetical protein
VRRRGGACGGDRRLDDRGIVRMMRTVEQRENAPHVIARLGPWRHAAVAVDHAFAGVVRGGRERDFAAVIRE